MAYDIGKIQRIYLGVQGEAASRPLEFNVQPWLDEFPEGSVSIYHLRNGQEESYPVACVLNREEGILLWKPNMVDTQYKGKGLCQFRVMEEGAVRKTRNVPTEVDPALPGTMSEDIPEAIVPFVELIEEYKNTAEQAAEDAMDAQEAAEAAQEAAEDAKTDAVAAKEDAERAAEQAESAAAHGPYIGVNSHWYVWDAVSESYADTGIVAVGHDGVPGDDGISPEVTFEVIEGGHLMTVTDAEHPEGQSISIMDGNNGDAGFSPKVTVTQITGGHQVKITDEEHPEGITFNVLDGVTPSAMTNAEIDAAMQH